MAAKHPATSLTMSSLWLAHDHHCCFGFVQVQTAGALLGTASARKPHDATWPTSDHETIESSAIAP